MQVSERIERARMARDVSESHVDPQRLDVCAFGQFQLVQRPIHPAYLVPGYRDRARLVQLREVFARFYIRF